MAQSTTRRQWLKTSATGAAGLALGTIGSASANANGPSSRSDKNPIKVVVWDEQQPAQKEAYENFLGNQIAAHLKTQEGLAVQSVKLDDPEQGLSPTVLNDCRILIWWGHVRNSEVSPETAKRIVERIKSGDLALIALHSAHWSAPFVEAMNERARLDLGEQFAIAEGERTEVHEIPPPQRFSVPKKDERPTPFAIARKYPRGFTELTLHLPYCCFPAYRNDGMPSQVRVLEPDHPIVQGVPRPFEIPRTERYEEP
ncbi:MAG: ThuA domain-containing protein, partial [Isosphaeraceae bacterium]